MLTKITQAVTAFTRKYPKWDDVITNYFDSDDNEASAYDQAIMDEFSDILKDTIDVAKEHELDIQELGEVFKNFTCWPFLEKYIKIKLGTFYEYSPLRKIANEDIYKAKYCVDLMWSSYILRFNPHMVFDDQIPMNEEDFKGVASQLDRFTDRCISRQLHRSSVIIELKEDSNLPQTLCEYIADKIEMDYNQIKLNYIIYRLSICEKKVNALSEKLLG